MRLSQLLKPGMILQGFCNGYFGRDSYEDKRVEAVGNDWVVVREVDSGMPLFAQIYDVHKLAECLPEWLDEPG